MFSVRAFSRQPHVLKVSLSVTVSRFTSTHYSSGSCAQKIICFRGNDVHWSEIASQSDFFLIFSSNFEEIQELDASDFESGDAVKFGLLCNCLRRGRSHNLRA